jgi:AraC family transcriptional regulator, ethanolamine operon transcriptional activator
MSKQKDRIFAMENTLFSPLRSHNASYTVRMSSRIQEASDHMRLLQGWGLRYEQLSRGRFEGNLREAWIDGIHLYQEALAQVVFQTGMARAGCVCLGVFAHLSGEAKWFGSSLTSDDVMFLGSGDELLLTTPQQSSLLVLCVPDTVLAAEDGLLAPPRKQVRNAALASRLRQSISDGLSSLITRPLRFAGRNARSQFGADMLGLIGEYFDRSADLTPTVGRDRAKSVVQGAIRYVEERRGEMPSIDDICQYTCTSRRTLQNCFEKITGESPAFFLKAQRLNAVRREILNAGEHALIGDLAADWGFWHFSQFSCDYKRLFGETPSETAHFARSMSGHCLS